MAGEGTCKWVWDGTKWDDDPTHVIKGQKPKRCKNHGSGHKCPEPKKPKNKVEVGTVLIRLCP
jgi:hypothetical protein